MDETTCDPTTTTGAPGVPFPHDLADLDAAISRLPAGRSDDALLHLALPVGEVVGIQAVVHHKHYGDVWIWRGWQAAAGRVQAMRLASCGARDEDRFLDLQADPVTWVKVLRSGAYLVAFGADLLFDLPLLRLDPSLADQANTILARVRAGELGLGGDERLDVTVIAGGWLIAPRPAVPAE